MFQEKDDFGKRGGTWDNEILNINALYLSCDKMNKMVLEEETKVI